jgi:signal transduction histidine kinase
MELTFGGFEQFLLSPAGILLYHGWILLIALGAAAFLLAKKPRGVWIRGLVLACAWILLQSLGLAGDLLARFWNSPVLASILAAADWALELAALSLLLWFFLFPRRLKTGDTLAAIWIPAVLLAGGGTAVYLYLYPSATAFNGNLLSILWGGLRAVVLLAGMVLLVIRRPAGWGLALPALFLFLIGVSLQLGFGDVGTNLPGISRIATLLAFPFAAMRLAYTAAGGGAMITTGSPARRIREASAESIPQLADLILTLEPGKLPLAVTSWICNAMRVEVSYFIATSEHGDSVEFISGYDRINSQPLPGFLVPTEAAPQLHFALTGRQMLRMGKQEAEANLRSAAEQAGLAQAGPALYAPLELGDEPALGILLLAAYSSEEWREEDEETARAFAQVCTAVFRQISDRSILEQGAEEYRQEAERLSAEHMDLEARLEQAEQGWRSEQGRSEGLASLVQGQDGVAVTGAVPEAGTEAEKEWMLSIQQKDGWITRLQEELESARSELLAAQRESAAAGELRAENQRLQEELHQAQPLSGTASPAPADGAEAARLRSALEESEKKYQQEVTRIQDELRKTLTEYAHLQSALLQPPPPPEGGKKLTFGADVGMVTGLISEIRQPFSSMVGYTDLLLSESAGILGAMQRKFLDRIRASITRTEALFEDLLQLLLLPEKIAAPRMQPVDVASIIDGAITGASETVREKNIVLRLDVDENMPPVEIDRDALQQILNHLVQNAVLITPPEKEVVVTTHTPLAEENQQLALLITVKDSGPGIAAEDQPRVFTRLYRTEGPLIEGLGDTGVGMAVVRTLTEAMGGRIWLESQVGHGTTFFVLLPVQIGQVLSAEAAGPEGSS